jgi:hypothetical protein
MALNKKRSGTKAPKRASKDSKKAAKAPKQTSKAAGSGIAPNGAPSERAVPIPEISVFSELPFKLVGTIGGRTARSDVAEGIKSEAPEVLQTELKRSKTARPSKKVAKKATKSSKRS